MFRQFYRQKCQATSNMNQTVNGVFCYVFLLLCMDTYVLEVDGFFYCSFNVYIMINDLVLTAMVLS